jgi:signal transduction histidine kinase
VLALLLGLSSAWLAATLLFSETLEKRLQAQLVDTVEMLSSGIFPYTPKLLERLSQLIHADIALLDSQGQITLSTLTREQETLQRELREILTGSNTAPPQYVQNFESSGEHYLLAWGGIATPRDPRVTLIAAFSNLTDIRETNQRMAIWLGSGALTGLLLLAWIGHRVSRSITLPIQALARMAGDIAIGKREVRAATKGNDEISDLARALNTMAEKLADYEQEIAKQSRMAALGQMTARIAHEIRNPLTAIKMQLQLLKETTNEQHQKLLNSLLDETRRLELIVLSTLQHKKVAQPIFALTNLNDLIHEIVRLLDLQFQHQGVTITLSAHPSLAEVAVDRDMITQILLNLLLNAKDEMPDGGEILLSTDQDEDDNRISFSVDDSGPGIPQKNWQTIFTDTTSDKPGGFGLGLRLCRELTELHNGQIGVSNSPLGGARIKVTLPMTGMNS